MKAIVIGTGQIGCGFVGQVLRRSGYEVVFVGRNPIMVEHVNRVKHYQVRLVQGPDWQTITVDGVRAMSTTAPDQVATEMASADLIATAVGSGSLPHVAPLIAAGLQRRRAPVNVLAFENLANASTYLRDLVANHLSGEVPVTEHGFSGALVNRAVTQRLGDPATDEPLMFVGDPPATFVVDGPNLRHPLPQVNGMVVVENYAAWIQRKLYTYSAGHATAAYLGYLKGYHYIHTAIRDPEIRATVLAAMREGQRGLAAQYGPVVAGDERDLLEIMVRFDNAVLNDPIERVGRDPRRKLGADDRLVGAARLAHAAGIMPEKLALAAAAALCFDTQNDPSASDLQRELTTEGLGLTLRHTSGLDVAQGLGDLVSDVWRRLTAGWQRGNLLVSLDRLVWSWSA
jgi:mannitol-1-phosphate 5-dehydrogenase